MFYPPPNADSSYKDDLTIDDNWNPSQQTDTYGYQPQSQQTQLPQAPTPVFGQRPPDYGAQNRQNQQSVSNLGKEMRELSNSLTQEDILFMRQWQRDSFFYRVIPITVTGWGLLYYYNLQKQKPTLISRYAAIAFGGFILGKWLYKDEFIRRVRESRSDTPYMQTFRKHFNLPQLNQNVGYNTQVYGDTNSFDETNRITEDPYNRPMGRSGGYKPYQPVNSEPNFDGGVTDNSDTQRQGTSYDELRARNRGIIR